MPPEDFAEEVGGGGRSTLARAITLIESQRLDDQEYAYEVLRLLMPAAGNAHRIGISGPPGVGKSTLIDAYGMLLVERGHQVAVLAIDPSSTLTGGSILGDKSRMPRLAQLDGAFIRPSPSDLALGGVTRRTREAMFLCEAAGFDRILIETVGVGQSEILVAGMVDTFAVLIQPGAGDELQGIKKGIVELADLLVVTKADGDKVALARQAVAEYSAAVRHVAGPRPVLAVSAHQAEGLAELADGVEAHRVADLASGRRDVRRDSDARRWIRGLAEEQVILRWRQEHGGEARLAEAARRALAGELRADQGATEVASAG
jgi:LAO/AO transport system kinase